MEHHWSGRRPALGEARRGRGRLQSPIFPSAFFKASRNTSVSATCGAILWGMGVQVCVSIYVRPKLASSPGAWCA